MEVLPPDDWEWVCEWKIDGSGGRDTGGWEYTKEIGKFDASRGEIFWPHARFSPLLSHTDLKELWFPDAHYYCAQE